MKMRFTIIAFGLGLVWGCAGSTETISNDVASTADVVEDVASLELGLPNELMQKDAVAQQELLLPDLQPVDVPTFDQQSCESGTGCFLEPCAEPTACQTGICLLHQGEMVCSETCLEECPEGFECMTSTLFGPDLMYVCMSLHPALCLPCESNKDCEESAGLGSACIEYGGDGHFCGAPCDADDDCPGDYSCQQSATVDGLLVSQCVAANACPCSAFAVSQALSTACFVGNEFGICLGQRTCQEGGLSECSAGVPQAELCDGEDNDCNTLVDDVSCDDGNPCTEDECLGADGCWHQPQNGGECLDGDACTIGDHCEQAVCLGAPLSCDDQNPCTVETCDSEFGCQYEFTNELCDDGNPCTYGDTCLAGTCTGLPGFCECQQDADCLAAVEDNLCLGQWYCDKSQNPYTCVQVPGSEVECDAPDGPDADCYLLQCNPDSGGCESIPRNQGADCHDGDVCTQSDQCVDGACVVGPQIDCDDFNGCTADSCDPVSGCVHLANQSPCDDGNACTVGDACAGGLCVWTELLVCADGNPCTSDECTPGGGCANLPLDIPCTDNDLCTTGDQCVDGTCSPGLPVDCADDNVCTDDSCDALVGCLHAPNVAPCDDGNQCTQGDHCGAGICGFDALVICDDNNPCTDDSCDTALGCVHSLNVVPCDDGDPCTINDVCNLGACVSGVTLYCNDNNPCTQDACKPGVGCEFVPGDGECDDGNDCTIGEACQAGSCVAQGMLDCDDSNICTKDICLPQGGCQNEPVPGPCEDGSVCTLGDSCVDGTCAPGQPLDCTDDNICTENWCDADFGCVQDVNDIACDDGDPCSVDDRCVLGQCAAGDPMDCDDSNLCTEDNCVPGQGCLFPPITPCCSNGNLEGSEQCDDGNLSNGDGCDSNCQEESGVCFDDWLVGTPCNGVNYGNGCVPSDTGYHYVGIHEGYACWWHHKNQAWNTSSSSNFWHLGQQFEITPGVGKCSWCHNKFSTPTPNSYDSCDSYFGPGHVGAWGWCAEGDNNSAGFVCIPTEGHVSCP